MRLLLLILLPIAAFSQADCNYTFSGKTTPGAVVVVTPQKGAVAGQDGNFVVRDLCAGNYIVQVTLLGYKSRTLDLQLKDNVVQDIMLEEETTQLNEIVVKEEKQNIEGAQNFVTLGEKELAESAGKTLGETLKEIPGVNTIQAGPGIFKPVIHGVHSTRVLILNHGIRQEGQQWGAEHAPEVDPFVASELIVVKDASAIKYGADALGGVVIVNPPPLPEKAGLGGSLNMVGQSNGRVGTISGMLEGGLKNHEGWGWRVQGTGKRAGDYHTATYQLTNTGSKELDFSAATGYHGKTFGAEVFFSHFQTELGILKGTAISNADDLEAAMERTPPQYTSSFSYHIGAPRQHVVHDLLKATVHKELRRGKLTFQYGLQNNGRQEYDIRIGTYANLPALDLKLTSHTFDGEWELSKENRYTLCFGANGMLQQNSNVFGTNRIPFIPNYTSFSGGPFAISKFYLKAWTVDVGVRYDYRHYDVVGYDYKNDLFRGNMHFQNVSGTAGATVLMKKGRSFSTSVSTAWRPPHVAELYSLGTHQGAAANEYGLLLNPQTNEVMDINDVNFKIEKAAKWVNTYRIEHERFQLEATAYTNFIFNYIYLKPIGITRTLRGTLPAFRYTQTDALFLGADISAQQTVYKRISLLTKISLIRASDYTNHDYLVFIPANRFELGARYDIHQWKKLRGVFFESKWKYTMRQTRAPRVIPIPVLKQYQETGTNPFQDDPSNFDFMAAPKGYFLWNVSAGIQVPTNKGRYEFRASIENLLNASYREYTNRFRYYANDLGSNFVVSAKYVF
ncbi:MAG TPA: TonB-dependent receptor [Cyclobacteriaceae bacterium]